MTPRENLLRALPDVANEPNPHQAGLRKVGALDWVGMDGIDLPIMLTDRDGVTTRSAARVSAAVDLERSEVRGIHMSRLYLLLDQHLSSEALTPCLLRRVLRDFLDSHADLSTHASVRIAFDQLLRRPALRSDNSGWKSYPIAISARLDGNDFQLELQCRVVYSSTCPASAALARQAIQDAFAKRFARADTLNFDDVSAWLGSEQGIVATPHGQRSAADVRVRLTAGFEFPIVDLIDLIEDAVQTPVQTAVKRDDEQAFAVLNAQNLMFCEDAARRIQRALDGDERFADFWLRATHYESLHAHNAVAIASKGIGGGYGADETLLLLGE
ncbi:MAG: GTP cyclohydrolase FolE2 [Dokdonella sp.]